MSDDVSIHRKRAENKQQLQEDLEKYGFTGVEPDELPAEDTRVWEWPYPGVGIAEGEPDYRETVKRVISNFKEEGPESIVGEAYGDNDY